jgi:hypothetical protein
VGQDSPRAVLHEWLSPRLDALFREAAEAGFEREAVLAVIIDLLTSGAFNDSPLPAEPPGPYGPGPDPADDAIEEVPFIDAEPIARPNLLGRPR